jgi:hypothetical protein
MKRLCELSFLFGLHCFIRCRLLYEMFRPEKANFNSRTFCHHFVYHLLFSCNGPVFFLSIPQIKVISKINYLFELLLSSYRLTNIIVKKIAFGKMWLTNKTYLTKMLEQIFFLNFKLIKISAVLFQMVSFIHQHLKD